VQRHGVGEQVMRRRLEEGDAVVDRVDRRGVLAHVDHDAREARVVQREHGRRRHVQRAHAVLAEERGGDVLAVGGRDAGRLAQQHSDLRRLRLHLLKHLGHRRAPRGVVAERDSGQNDVRPVALRPAAAPLVRRGVNDEHLGVLDVAGHA